MPMWAAISFQDSNSPYMEHLSFFHDHTMIIIISVTLMVAYLMVSSIMNLPFSQKDSESPEMELFWTVLPAGLLIFIALPSMKILYLTDEMMNSGMTVKATGNQWFWNYEYSEMKTLQFDSFMDTDNFPRLILTNNYVIVPSKISIRLLTTSNDVIHSWTIPSTGVKVDAMPGRLNQMFLTINRIGILTGQCSEICGLNHSFMPITISSMPTKYFIETMIKMI